jgi:hypothetical protein
MKTAGYSAEVNFLQCSCWRWLYSHWIAMTADLLMTYTKMASRLAGDYSLLKGCKSL